MKYEELGEASGRLKAGALCNIWHGIWHGSGENHHLIERRSASKTLKKTGRRKHLAGNEAKTKPEI